jgi:drug/metabolite transporter (DMT)-like permease
MLGVSTIVLLGSARAPGAAAVENILPLASAISFALYTVLGRRAFTRGNTLAVIAGSTRYGLLFLLPFTIVEMMQQEMQPVTVRDGLLLLYLGAGCSALAFVLRGYGLIHLEAAHGAVYGNLKPLVGVALAVVLLGEHLTFHQVAGGILVLIGVAVASSQVTKLVFLVSTVPLLRRREQRAPIA